MKKTYEIKYVSTEISKDIFGEISKQEGFAVYSGSTRMSFIYDTKEDAQKDLDKLVAHNL